MKNRLKKIILTTGALLCLTAAPIAQTNPLGQFLNKVTCTMEVQAAEQGIKRLGIKDSDIDIVVDTKELDIPTIEKLKNAFIPMKADVLITDLLKQEDTALDDLLISIGVGKNLDSVYKSIMREVIWVGEKS